MHYGSNHFGSYHFASYHYGASVVEEEAAPAASAPVVPGGGRAGRSVGGRDPRWLQSRHGRGDPHFERLVTRAVREAFGEPPVEALKTDVDRATDSQVQAVTYRLFTSPVLAAFQGSDAARRLMAAALAQYEGSQRRAFLEAAETPFDDEDAAVTAVLMALV